jgi:hypothetical protein
MQQAGLDAFGVQSYLELLVVASNYGAIRWLASFVGGDKDKRVDTSGRLLTAYLPGCLLTNLRLQSILAKQA